MKRVSPEIESAILRHHLVDQWPVGTVACQLGIHHAAVRRVIAQHGMPEPTVLRRTRLIEPYVDFLRTTLQKYPRIRATRLYFMVKDHGYCGSVSSLRREVAKLRPKQAPEPFLRLAKLPGEQAQVDWGSFGTVQVGQAFRKLYAFVMCLSWSRALWLQFFFDMQMANFLRGHVDAFRYFGGQPRKVLYDNLKSAVIEREGSAIRFNSKLLELANHYGFEPIAAAPRRGNEKGRVERSIRYARDSFFAARVFRSIEQLNEEALDWCRNTAEQRKWVQDDSQFVYQALQEERSKLRALPSDDFPAYDRTVVRVGKTPYIRFDRNDYSVPIKLVRSSVEVLSDHKQILVVSDGLVQAKHHRSFSRRAVVEDPSHIEQLRAYKRKAQRPSGGYRLNAAAPSTQLFLTRGAERGHNLGSLTANLLGFLDEYGADALEAAVTAINERDIVNIKAVRLWLQQQARAANRKPLQPVKLPRKDLEHLHVSKPDLGSYDLPNSDEQPDTDNNEGPF